MIALGDELGPGEVLFDGVGEAFDPNAVRVAHEQNAAGRRTRAGRPLARKGCATVRLALRKGEAVAALGISDESFDRYVKPRVPVVRIGSRRLYPVSELQRFLEANG